MRQLRVGLAIGGDRTVGRVHCPMWSLDLFLLQGLPSETRWLPGQRPVGGVRPELVRYGLFFGPWDVRLALPGYSS